MKPSEKNRIIKKALKEAYIGFANISVKGESGTAYGWVIISITFPISVKPENDQELREVYRNEIEKAVSISRKALEEVGEKFYTYLSDDGYDTERECVLVNIHYE